MITGALRLALALAVAGTALAATHAGAIVPPKDCGRISVGSHRYNIKADQLKCSSARRYSARYLRTRHGPRDYACHRFRGSALVFRCVNTRANPDRTFFAIKR